MTYLTTSNFFQSAGNWLQSLGSTSSRSSMCHSALECAHSYLWLPISDLSYGFYQESKNHIKTVAPAVIALATNSLILRKAATSTLVVHSVYSSVKEVFRYCNDIAKGSTKILSLKTVKVLSYHLYSLFLTYMLYQVPQDKYYTDMKYQEQTFYLALYAHSNAICFYLAFSAANDFYTACIIPDSAQASYFSNGNKIKWGNLGRGIPKLLLAYMIYQGNDKQFREVASRTTRPKLEGEQSLRYVMDHLPGEDLREVSDFFTLKVDDCLNSPQSHFNLKECFETNVKALERYMRDSPDLLARIYKLRMQYLQTKYRPDGHYFKTFGEFLSQKNGIALYFQKEASDLTPFEKILSRQSFEHLTHTFECYEKKQILKFPENLSPSQLDSSRCYRSTEINFIAERNIARHLGLGTSDSPAIYIEGATDWNGAFKKTFAYQSGQHLNEPFNPVIQFIRDHKRIFFAQVKNRNELCMATETAHSTFGEKPSRVIMSAHGDANYVTLHDGKTLPGKASYLHKDFELTGGCLRGNLAEDTTWVMLSCNAGKPNWGRGNIAQKMSQELPEGAVVIADETKTAIRQVLYHLNPTDQLEVHFYDPASDSFNITTTKYQNGRRINPNHESVSKNWVRLKKEVIKINRQKQKP